MNKQPPFLSTFYPIYNQERKYLKPLSGHVYNFSIKQVHQYDKEQNKQDHRIAKYGELLFQSKEIISEFERFLYFMDEIVTRTNL